MAFTRACPLRIALLILLLSCGCAGAGSRSPNPGALPTATQPVDSNPDVVLPSATTARAAPPARVVDAATQVPATFSPVDSTPERPTVLVISWDGAPAGQVQDWMDSGDLPHFAELAQQGRQAVYAQAPDPPLTFTAHASLVSGALPARTGLVSNNFHDSTDSFYWYRESSEEPFDSVEPVWVAAARAGLKTATVAFPGSSTTRPAQMADLTIDYGLRLAYSRQAEVKLANVPASIVAGWQGLPDSYSPVLQGLYRIPSVAQVHLLALDQTNDGTESYDTVVLLPDDMGRPLAALPIGPKALKLRTGEWGSLLLAPGPAAGADFLVQAITSQAVTLYHTQVNTNRAAPRFLLEAINDRFGPFPAGGDAYALEHGWITEADYLHEIDRAARWTAGVTAWLYETYHPDLLFAWQETFDAAGHAFLLTDERQPGYSSERARLYAGYLRQAAHIADQALADTLASVQLDHTAVLLVSDHGMAPAHTRVYVNTLLEQAGLLVLDRRDYVVVDRTQAMAVASGGAMHVYINLQGREEDGIVPMEDYPALQARLAALLADLTDPQTGERVFARVLTRAGLAALGLDHPHSGDVFAQVQPGYCLDGWRGQAELFTPCTSYGQHGYESSLPEMRAIFIAAGGDLPADGGMIPPVRLVDVTPTLARLLGFELARAVDGQPIGALFEP